jgi:hypothetical protein
MSAQHYIVLTVYTVYCLILRVTIICRLFFYNFDIIHGNKFVICMRKWYRVDIIYIFKYL